ncbi:RDD family protein [Desulfogranum mediterraneum]|uniref:RDD family protein n=1 Tax=Desulfogranum mediterraneum TaxID=160661 RepID=UPI0003FF45B3|nr:RDD family protein [Desulfogranum mediterraneum]
MNFEICGFWRRIGAFSIDGLILGAGGVLLGLFLTEQLAALGAWGRGFGFILAGLYFGLGNSHLTNGQTLGKRLLGIKVLARHAHSLSIPQSLLRYLIIGIPYFLNGARLSGNALHSGWIYLLSLSVFGLGFSIVYLLIFNRRTRQSLHDLLVGSYVVKKEGHSDTPAKTVWPVHYAICGILVIASLALPYLTARLAQRDQFAQLLEVQARAETLAPVTHASISNGQTTFTPFSGTPATTTYISCQVYLDKNTTDNEPLAAEIADIILSSHGEAELKDLIRITLTYGYDIGIASFWQSKQYAFSTEEWRVRAKQATAPQSSSTEPPAPHALLGPGKRRTTPCPFS